MKPPRRLLAVVASLLVCLVLLLLMDGAFRLYERWFLIQDVARLEGPFDLQSMGYHHHGPPATRQKPPGVFRVLSIGDSFAYAITTPPYTYAARLERLLANATPAEVLNLGAPGVSFPEYLRQAGFWAERLEHDAVIFNIYVGNDFLNVEGTMVDETRTMELRTGPGTRVPRKHSLRFLDYVSAMLKTREMRHDAAGDARFYDPDLAGDLPADRYPRIMRDSALPYRPDKLSMFQTSPQWCFELLQQAAAMQRQGTQVVVLVSPPHLLFDDHWRTVALEGTGLGPEGVDPFLPGVLIRHLADEAGLAPNSVVDLYPCFREAQANGTALYHGLNTHWTVEGNELAAQALFRALRPETPPPAGACSLAPRQGAADDARMEPVLRNIRQAEALEAKLLAPLAGKTFPSRRAVETALKEAGYTPDPAILGLVDSVLDGERDAVWLQGWALRRERPQERHALLAFHDDRLAGAGITQQPREDVGARHGLSPEASRELGFHFQAALPQGLRPGDDLMVVAVSEGGGFAFLKSDEFTPRRVRPGE